jgi:vancomycin resistance protein YoaR
MPSKKKQKLFIRPGWLIGAAFFVLIIAALVLPLVLQQVRQHRIYPRVVLGDFDLGGLTGLEAKLTLQEIWGEVSEPGFEFMLNNERVVIAPFISAPGDPDLTYNLVTLDIDATLESAFRVGRQGSYFNLLQDTYTGFRQTLPIKASMVVNTEPLKEVLNENFANQIKPSQNASFDFTAEPPVIRPEQSGVAIDLANGLYSFEDQLARFENKPINLSLIKDEPTVKALQIRSLISPAQAVVDRAPFSLTAEYEDAGRLFSLTTTIPKTTIATWLAPVLEDGQIKLGFGNIAKEYLAEKAQEINQEPQDAKFEITKQQDLGEEKDQVKKIDQFQASRDGFQVDIDKSLVQMRQDLIDKKQTESKLVLSVTKPQVTTAQVNDLGITEIIGSGSSDFSGSPANRRHNIQVSSDKLNGLLIAPGEEFSLVSALKPFTSEAGYLAELVIKGNRLIPEIGGGACQIGTTTFRAALDSGLEISQRRNHSFAVSYYNDENGLPGTDATIYDPAPDFRFINTTKNHILIQTHVGTDDILTYEFWGSSDGRQASITKPVILATKAAPVTKYIETEDLPVGELDCSGSNVPGYTTTFTYNVTTASGETKQENFDSYYRPWQRVCLVGVEKATKEEIKEVN